MIVITILPTDKEKRERENEENYLFLSQNYVKEKQFRRKLDHPCIALSLSHGVFSAH